MHRYATHASRHVTVTRMPPPPVPSQQSTAAPCNKCVGGGRRGQGQKGRGNRGRVAGGSSLENLHAMVEGVSHDDAPVAVDGNAAKRGLQLSVA
jgi:hypothetical protein